MHFIVEENFGMEYVYFGDFEEERALPLRKINSFSRPWTTSGDNRRKTTKYYLQFSKSWKRAKTEKSLKTGCSNQQAGKTLTCRHQPQPLRLAAETSDQNLFSPIPASCNALENELFYRWRNTTDCVGEFRASETNLLEKGRDQQDNDITSPCDIRHLICEIRSVPSPRDNVRSFDNNKQVYNGRKYKSKVILGEHGNNRSLSETSCPKQNSGQQDQQISHRVDACAQNITDWRRRHCPEIVRSATESTTTLCSFCDLQQKQQRNERHIFEWHRNNYKIGTNKNALAIVGSFNKREGLRKEKSVTTKDVEKYCTEQCSGSNGLNQVQRQESEESKEGVSQYRCNTQHTDEAILRPSSQSVSAQQRFSDEFVDPARSYTFTSSDKPLDMDHGGAEAIAQEVETVSGDVSLSKCPSNRNAWFHEQANRPSRVDSEEKLDVSKFASDDCRDLRSDEEISSAGSFLHERDGHGTLVNNLTDSMTATTFSEINHSVSVSVNIDNRITHGRKTQGHKTALQTCKTKGLFQLNPRLTSCVLPATGSSSGNATYDEVLNDQSRSQHRDNVFASKHMQIPLADCNLLETLEKSTDDLYISSRQHTDNGLEPQLESSHNDGRFFGRITTDNSISSPPPSAMKKRASLYSPSKKQRVKFDLDLEIHVVPRSTSSQTSSATVDDDDERTITPLTEFFEGSETLSTTTSSHEQELQGNDHEFPLEPCFPAKGIGIDKVKARPSVSPFRNIKRSLPLAGCRTPPAIQSSAYKGRKDSLDVLQMQRFLKQQARERAIGSMAGNNAQRAKAQSLPKRTESVQHSRYSILPQPKAGNFAPVQQSSYLGNGDGRFVPRYAHLQLQRQYEDWEYRRRKRKGSITTDHSASWDSESPPYFDNTPTLCEWAEEKVSFNVLPDSRTPQDGNTSVSNSDITDDERPALESTIDQPSFSSVSHFCKKSSSALEANRPPRCSVMHPVKVEHKLMPVARSFVSLPATSHFKESSNAAFHQELKQTNRELPLRPNTSDPTSSRYMNKKLSKELQFSALKLNRTSKSLDGKERSRHSVSVNASGNFHFAELSEGARSVLKDAHRAYVDTCNDLQSQSGQRQRQSHGNLSSSYSEEQQVQKSHRILRQKFDSTKHSLPQKFDGSSVNSTHQQGIQKRVLMRQQNSNQMINLLPQSQSMIDPLQTSTLTVSSLGLIAHTRPKKASKNSRASFLSADWKNNNQGSSSSVSRSDKGNLRYVNKTKTTISSNKGFSQQPKYLLSFHNAVGKKQRNKISVEVESLTT